MRRRLLLAAAALSTAISLILLLRTSAVEPWRKVILDDLSLTGSDFIDKDEGAEDKVLVLAKTQEEDVDWVHKDLKDWQRAIYRMDDPQHVLHPPKNVGREAMAYLTFLIDHYHNLPEIMVFLHPHLDGWPQAWHTDARDNNNVKSVKSLKLDYVREHGYANMRCMAKPGCPAEIHPFRNDTSRSPEMAFKDAWLYFFGGTEEDVPRQVGTPCCSQFAVSKIQVLKRPQADYRRYRQWLLHTELSSEDSGRVMEYMWHIIFGKDPVWCPSLFSCYCDQFDRC